MSRIIIYLFLKDDAKASQRLQQQLDEMRTERAVMHSKAQLQEAALSKLEEDKQRLAHESVARTKMLEADLASVREDLRTTRATLTADQTALIEERRRNQALQQHIQDMMEDNKVGLIIIRPYPITLLWRIIR